MHVADQIQPSDAGSRYVTILARVVFFIYIFVLFFGTSTPFQDRAVNVEDFSTSNFRNQVVFVFLFLASCFCLIPKRNELYQLIRREKFLTLFILWCFISIGWSDYAFVSFKRWFQLLTSFTTISAFLLNGGRSDRSLKSFTGVLFLYIITSIFSVVFISGAIDPSHQTWRGLEITKNFLGQSALVCIVLLAYMIRRRPLKRKFILVAFLILSVILLIGSRSMTSIGTFLIILYIVVLVFLDRIFRDLGIGKSFSAFLMAASLLLMLTVFYFGRDIIEHTLMSFGRDLTFTGRTELWVDLVKTAKDRLVFGYGFGGFWVIDFSNTDLMVLYDKYVWLPNEAHSGYLDIILQVGFIGFFIFMGLIVSYFRNIVRLHDPPFGFWLVVAVMILNLQESTLFCSRILTGELFLFSYMLLYSGLLPQNNPAQPVTSS